ncbi:MAG: hypothetical protein U9Q90_07485 [Campylobacterota bacterium]|nr:hypothetical protein [Campylobacterota bacterium]
MMPNETIDETIEEWIEKFKNTPGVKALEAAYNVFSFLDEAYEIWEKIFFPEPSDVDQILQAITQLREEIRDIETDKLRDAVDGLLDTYHHYMITHHPDYPVQIDMQISIAREELETVIENWDARSAYRVAEAYNLLIPLSAVNLLQVAAHSEELGQAPDWPATHKEIFNTFARAIEVNQKLLGPYVFEELPNIPCYAAYYGKLGMHFGIGRGGSNNFTEYLRITEVVWQATECLRESTIEGYPDFWFIINGYGSLCLHASTSDPSVRGVFRIGQDHQNILWRVEYLRHDTAQIIHWSGDCLTVDDSCRVRIRPCRDNYEGQLWNITSSTSRSSVRCISDKCGGDGLNVYYYKESVVSTGYSPGVREALAFRVSDPDDAELIPAAGGFAFQNRAPRSKQNFDIFVHEGDHIQHYWRGWKDGRWHKGQSFGANVKSAPAAFQNFAPGSMHNLEIFVQEGDHIQHYWRGWKDNQWRKGQSIGENVRSAPAAFQNQASGSKYNYEVFVHEGDHIQHYWRGWKDGRWRKGQSFGTNVKSAPAAFQNWLGSRWSEYNYEIFVHEGDHIQHYWRGWYDGRWVKGKSFGTNVKSAPSAFQNFEAESRNSHEVFVQEGDHIQHYYRIWQLVTSSGNRPPYWVQDWRKGQSFGTNVQSAPAAFQNQASGSKYNYEVFVHEGDHIQHYWRGWKDGRWHKDQSLG